MLADLVHLQDQPSKFSLIAALECVRLAIGGMLYADSACIVSRSPRGLEQMMVVFVEVFGAFSLTISKSKTETMCRPSPRAPATQIVFNATGQQYRLTISFAYLGGAVIETPKVVKRDRPADPCGVDELQVLRAGAVRPPEGKPAAPEGPEGEIRGSGGFPIRIHDISTNNRIPGYKNALQRTRYEIIKTTVRTRRLLWSEALLRIGDHRYPRGSYAGTFNMPTSYQ